VRNFVEKTRNDYIRHVKTFAAFLGRAPDTATAEDLRGFQLHQTQSGAGCARSCVRHGQLRRLVLFGKALLAVPTAMAK
jgi:hypothetical protein